MKTTESRSVLSEEDSLQIPGKVVSNQEVLSRRVFSRTTACILNRPTLLAFLPGKPSQQIKVSPAAIFWDVGWGQETTLHVQGWEFGVSLLRLQPGTLHAACPPSPSLPAPLASGMEPTTMPGRVALPKDHLQGVPMRTTGPARSEHLKSLHPPASMHPSGEIQLPRLS